MINNVKQIVALSDSRVAKPCKIHSPHKTGDNVANVPVFTLSLRHDRQHYRSIFIILNLYLKQITVVHRKKV